jgi:hypothetical protein
MDRCGNDRVADREAWPPLGDDELERLALAADPDEPLAPDATPIYLHASDDPGSWGEPPWAGPGHGEPGLPSWYMAPVRSRRLGGWYRVVVLAVIGAFLLIEAVGLCSTYGQLPMH